jgi:chromosome segregation ATPase
MNLVLNVPPDPYQQIASLQHALKEKSLRVAELEQELREERMQNADSAASVEALRNTLLPLYAALQRVFGHIDGMGIAGNSSAHVSDSKREVWESWKQKLGGLTAKAIDVLMLHGPMNQTQLRIQLACASRSVTNIVGALNKAGLINKVDGKIALKEL